MAGQATALGGGVPSVDRLDAQRLALAGDARGEQEEVRAIVGIEYHLLAGIDELDG